MPERRSATTAGSAPTPPTKPAKRQKVDWDAVERDYRTGKFSDTELSIKHSVARESIVRRRKSAQADDPTAWAQDLGPQVRAATNALLMQETVAQKITEGHAQVTGVILAAAEVNARIIQSHRVRLSALHDSVELAKSKLEALGDSVADIREAAVYVQAVGNLATASKTLIDQERKAYRLDDDPAQADEGNRKRVLLEFVDAEVKSA